MDLSAAGHAGDGSMGEFRGVEVEGFVVFVRIWPDCVAGIEVIVMIFPDCVVVMTGPMATGLVAACSLLEKKAQPTER